MKGIKGTQLVLSNSPRYNNTAQPCKARMALHFILIWDGLCSHEHDTKWTLNLFHMGMWQLWWCSLLTCNCMRVFTGNMTELSILYCLFIYKGNAENNQELACTKCLYLIEQQRSSAGNTIIHTATRGHWFTGNKHESHWGQDKSCCCNVEEAGDRNSDHESILCLFRPMHSRRTTRAAQRHGSTASLTSQTHTAEGHIWISLHYNNTLYDCMLHSTGRINIYKSYIYKCERNGGIKGIVCVFFVVGSYKVHIYPCSLL